MIAYMRILIATKLRKSALTLNCFLIAVAFFFYNKVSFSQKANTINRTMEVGVARIDITPQTPIRLAGYGNRKKSESEGVINRLEAKALAFGRDAQHPSIFITVDLVGIPGHITEKLAEQLSANMNIDRAHIVISASHTHGGPEVGNLLNVLQY